MATRTTAQLAQDFPISSTPLLVKSIAKFDHLVNAGFVGDAYEMAQLLAYFGAAIAPLAEAFAAPTCAYTGAAGTLSREYKLAATYPLEIPPGSASNASGRYLNALPGKPPQGRPPASAAASTQNAEDQRTRRYGVVTAASAAIANTKTTLDATDYVTVTADAADNIPGVTFDVLVDDGLTGTFYYIGNVAAGASFKDIGQTRLPYKPYAYPEVGYDSSQPVGSQIVYGPKTVSAQEGS